MPNKAGRLTPMEREFVKHMAATNDATYAATKAGYAFPSVVGSKLASNPILKDATREEGSRLLRDKAGTVGVVVLLTVALDEMQPGNTRVNAAKSLVEAAGMKITDAAAEKDPSEMSMAEINANLARAERQLEAYRHAASDRAKPILDHEETIPKNDPFG